MSYNNEGIMTMDDIKEIMSLRGSMDILQKIIIDLKRIRQKIGIIKQIKRRSICILWFVSKFNNYNIVCKIYEC